MVGIIVLSVIVWLWIPPVLSKAMARRGFDGPSYLIIGMLFGPVAVVFAVMDVLFDVPEPPRILETGRTGGGDVSILVVGGDSTLSLSMITLGGFGSRLRRFGLAHVLPKGGARLDEVQAERDLRQAAMTLGHPELALLFGRPDVAISEYAIARGYDVVVTRRPDRLLADRLQRSGRAHWSVDDVPRLGPGWLTTGESQLVTEPLAFPASAPLRSARTV